MNLLDLLNRTDPVLVVDAPKHAPQLTKFRCGGDAVRGLTLAAETKLTVKRVNQYWPNFAHGFCGFEVQVEGKKDGLVEIEWKSKESSLLSERVEVKAGPIAPLKIPVPSCDAQEDDLSFSITSVGQAPLFLGVHRVPDRAPLLQMCRGYGVELGPGHQPQVLPSSQVDVHYVEEKSAEEWSALYGTSDKYKIDPKLWTRYVIGTANAIPSKPRSLDFLFSSHVFEHLANPLGHLAYWHSLLKPNGVVVAVVPDKENCKDYKCSGSTEAELIDEWNIGDMKPALKHYERWCKLRELDTPASELLAAGRSIHVHFYTPDSLAQILGRFAIPLGYSDFQIIARPNHKDFHFVLRKGF